MIGSTGKFKVKTILFNDGEFAIAQGHWEGQESLSTACRWHETEGIGYPQTFGKPQWMILPTSDIEIEGSGQTDAPLIKLGFGKTRKPFYSLELIDESSGYSVHTIRSESPFSPIAVGDYFSAPQARFPDEAPSKRGRLVKRIQHIVNEVDGVLWHSTMVTLGSPES
ncbi:hypothetical protein ACF8GD_16200 [Pseudomonas putida]|uniref:hypothetical protein n=1 Tax=Pseudomonas putida TaxID=303 RepID=UPI003709DBEF